MPSTPDKVACMCGQEFDRYECVAVKLTAAERDELRKMGMKPPPSTLFYCKPCWNLLHNPELASQLMKGMAQHHLQQSGVPHPQAEKMAEEYRQKLLKRAQEMKDAHGKSG